MELHQLRYFLTVYREGTLTRAAERLYLAQPSLSEQIRKLEQELGAPLFERLPRRLVLTAAGEAFLAHAERALQEVEDGRSAVRDVLDLRRGRAAIGVLPSVGATVLPGAAAEFRRHYPDVRFILREESASATIAEAVRAGELDLAVIRLPKPEPELASKLFLREPLMLVTAPEHRLAGRPGVSVAELEDEPFVALKPGYGLREVLVQTCRTAGFEPRIVADGGQIELVRGLALAGMGVTILPALAVGQGGQGIPLSDEYAVRELYFVWRKQVPLTAAPQAFLEILEQLTQNAMLH